MGIKSINIHPTFILSGLFLLFLCSYIEAQINSVGTPFIKNYSRSDFKAGQQNWMIDQGQNGRLYFANNDGILEFDGLFWSLHPLPKGILARSIFVSDDGRIYTGGFNEFGYFEPDSIGQLVYHSLLELLKPEDRDFDEIWRIHNTPDGLVFQSFKQLIVLEDNEAHVIKAPGNFHLSYFVNGQLLVVDLEEGILRYSMKRFFPLLGVEALKGLEIWAILPFGSKLLLATANQGVYIYDGNQLVEWSNSTSEFLKQNQVYSAIRLNDDYLAFGSIQDGLVICTNDGIVVRKINMLKGLQNNTILSLRMDNSGNLWLGTDNGIDYIEINSPLSVLSYEHGLSAGYAAKLVNNILYLGTNQGVFWKPIESFVSTENNEKFKLIESTRGQVWTLQLIDNQLFCGSNTGTFLIDETDATKISDVPGGWTYVQSPKCENNIIAGTYSGLLLFQREGNRWYESKKIKGFNESSRLLEADEDGSIWMSHGFKGVFHIYLNEDLDSATRVDFYNSSDGFENEIGINVTRLRNKIYFSADDGLYEYNRAADNFEKSTFINDYEFEHISKLREDENGNIWYFANKESGVLRKQEDGGYTNINLPFKQIKGNFIGGFEFVYPVDEENVLFGASHGFIHYNPNQFKNYQLPFSTYINKVSIYNPDSIIYSGHKPKSDNFIPGIDFRNNALHFTFSANDYENPGRTEFSTFLEGYETVWTSWEIRHSREFTNLYEGDYTFHVKARNIYGVETETVHYQFTINPPWKRT
ncbi:MAG: triple tyrosine motif-containing protein [Bacteroidales bacterium]